MGAGARSRGKVGMSHMGHYDRVRVDLAGWDGGRPALVSVGVPPGSGEDPRSQAMTLAWQMSQDLGDACDHIAESPRALKAERGSFLGIAELRDLPRLAQTLRERRGMSQAAALRIPG